MTQDELHQLIGQLVDHDWYTAANADVRGAGIDPAGHFISHGAAEGRDPNPYFRGGWYVDRYPDVRGANLLPIVHYMLHGAAELRDPHPGFDAAWYVDTHPAAAANPMLFHLLHGAARGLSTRHLPRIADYLPATGAPLAQPGPGLRADILIPVYLGLNDTRACLDSVLADGDRVPGRVIVVDDASPDPAVAALLDAHAAAGRITLVRNPENLGFVRSANAGMCVAGTHDVILLNSDTIVPRGWTRRLAAHAYAGPNVATVSPFSNNATICGYPTLAGGPPAFGLPVDALDAACAAANPGRSLPVPVTVGFAMYIRHAAIAAVGLFDAERFGRGYGEETDFCLRAAAAGWVHRLAADVYVHHTGKVSFGADAPEAAASQRLLAGRYPTYAADIARHVRLDPAIPARFAITATLFRASALPVIALISHALGGGVRLHAERLASRMAGRAHVIMAEAGAAGVTLTLPHLPGHPSLTLGSDRNEDLATLLRAMAVSRVHLHHAMGAHTDLRALIAALGVPFDLTIHDWYVICPQVNLLPQLDQTYCGEPAPAICDACIRERPGNDAADIVAWRTGVRWMVDDAARVIVPSEDARARLARHGITGRVVVAPHEAVSETVWRVARRTAAAPSALRVLLLGVLADQKGARVVEDVARLSAGTGITLHLIGAFERPPDPVVANAVTATGPYTPDELPALIERLRPDIAWFPAPWPETYSYTLSEALAAGLPIVAASIGAFPERLAGRPLTWLLPPDATAAQWLAAFTTARTALRAPARKRTAARTPVPDFYGPGGGYLEHAKPRPRGVRDMRRADRLTLIVIPERLDGTGGISPCGYIRLILPLSHPQAAPGVHIIVATATEALHYRADAVVTQRYAVPSVEEAEALAGHCRANGMRLLYDLDDDLLAIPLDHPEAPVLRPREKIVRRMLSLASAVTVSTHALRTALGAARPDAVVIENGLDERLWAGTPPPRPAFRGSVLRVLLMGTATHDGDLAMIFPALAALHGQFAERLEFCVIGMTSAALPPWARRMPVPASAAKSYPAFVSWLTSAPPFHLGLAPLADTRFNASKSAIKVLDHAALGLPVLASDVAAYRGGIASELLPPDPDAWYAAVAGLLRDPARWRDAADAAYAAWMRTGTLASQADARSAALLRLVTARERGTAAA